MQNGLVKMTKEAYFEMCEALGTEPVESEIPVSTEDFPHEIQEILEIYRYLKDEWDPVGGNYLGKSFTGMLEIFNLFQVPAEDRILYVSLLYTIDAVRAEEMRKQKPGNSNSTAPAP